MQAGPEFLSFRAELDAANLREAALAFQAAFDQAALPKILGWRAAWAWGDDPYEPGLPSDPDVVLPERSGGVTYELSGQLDEGSNASLAQDEDGALVARFSFGTESLDESEIVARIDALAESCRSLARAGHLRGAALDRMIGGELLPSPPIAGLAHLLVCSVAEVDAQYRDPSRFWAAWDQVEDLSGGLRLCVRAREALANPDFLAALLGPHMALAREAEPGAAWFSDPGYEVPGERALLDAEPPSLREVFYDPGERRIEYAIVDSRPIRLADLRMLWRASLDHRCADGRAVERTYVRASDDEQASREVRLLAGLGVDVWVPEGEGFVLYQP